jgi:hypothetical protein
MTPSQEGQGLVFSSIISSFLAARKQKLAFVIDRELQIERSLTDNGFVAVAILFGPFELGHGPLTTSSAPRTSPRR